MSNNFDIKPPRLASKLFEWYCGNAMIEDLQGDMEELFYANIETMSPLMAKILYCGQVISLMFSYAIRKRRRNSAFHPYSTNSMNVAMIFNYLKIAFRSLLRNRSYSILNIAGLSVAVAASLIITLFVVHELSYDRYNDKADRIYRLDYEVQFGNNHAYMPRTPAITSRWLQQDYPEIESSVRFLSYGTYLVKSEQNSESIKEQNVIWTDSTFFNIFSVKVLEGNPATALAHPGSLAISKRTAQKYFSGQNALGQSLLLDNKYSGVVTAVYEDIPETSHFHFDILISLVGDWLPVREAKSMLFSNNNFSTYLLLKEGTDAKHFESKLPGFLKKYSGGPAVQAGSDFSRMTLRPLLDIHLYSDLDGELEPNGSITYIYLFASIATLILMIACINFMNLATAYSSNRAKEVGVRKVMGSKRFDLIWQFLMESVLIAFFALVAAMFIAYLSLPLFNVLLLKQLYLPFGNPMFYLILIGMGLIIGIMAGAYPSFFLSAFNPANILKGKIVVGTRGGFLRSGLVVFQFVISIFLIVAAITVNKQLTFIQNMKLGFDKEQVLLIKDAYALRPNGTLYKDEITEINAVQHATISGFLPVKGGSEFPRRDRTFWKEGKQVITDNLVSIQQWSVDHDYIQTLGMNVIKGRDFLREFPSDSRAVVLNESAVERFELGDDPIGKKIVTFGGDRVPDFDHPIEYTVIGVMEDFHFSSMKEEISSLGLFLGRSDGFIGVRFNGDPEDVIDALRKKWKEMAPGQPFQYSFLDDEFENMYLSEQRLGKIFNLFATLAIVIGCFGLFALTAYIAKQRTKEIGIRKVLGASVSNITMMLSREFVLLIGIAIFISLPLGWYFMNQWLQDFTYRMDLSIWIFILSGIATLSIGLLTISFQAIKAAMADPVKSIKVE
ncbi:MAG TPA: ABC transporter permease [Cyclobacteriaceae bacterium]